MKLAKMASGGTIIDRNFTCLSMTDKYASCEVKISLC